VVAWPPAEGQVLSVRFSIALLPEHPLEELLDAAWGRSLEGVPSLAG
jgi:hypothetical protein